MAQKTRNELKDTFKQGAKPSGQDFADFIDSIINSRDDGIEKRSGDQPLKIKAWGGGEKALELCGTDDQLRWSLALKSDDKSGLSIDSPSGSSKLFLDASGKLGVGTAAPAATLHVNGDGKTSGALAVGGALTVSGKTTVSGDLVASKAVTMKGATTMSGDLSVAKTLSVTGITTLKGALGVSGNTTLSGTASFGKVTRQMINLYQTTYGIGVQSSTQYFRSNKNFAWYKKGSHNNSELNAGTGGSELMSLNSSGLSVRTQVIRKIAIATGLGPNDGRDNGQIKSRVLTFNKLRDDTAIRIVYCDNLRVNGSNVGARWEIRINDKSAPGGKLYYDKYSSTGNYHAPTTVIGYATKVKAGKCQIQIWVAPAPGYAACDSYTGWNKSRWTLEAQEVWI